MESLRSRLQLIQKKTKRTEEPKKEDGEHFFFGTKRKRTYAVRKLKQEGYTYFQEFLMPGEAKQFGLYALKSSMFTTGYSYWGRSTQLKPYEWRS